MGGPDIQSRQERLSTYFEKSATVVLQSAKSFEQVYARPWIDKLAASFQRRPIRSAFLSMLFALSILPILSFVGFSLFIFASCVFVGLTGAVVVSTVVILALSAPFVAILMMLFCISLFLTGSGLGAYLLFRLLVMVRDNGARAGVAGWAQETKTRIRSPPEQPSEESRNQHDGDEDAASDGSDTFTAVSAVVVDHPAKSESSQGSGDDIDHVDRSVKKEVQ
ncbi:hypothetical protein CERSUDRAFT_114969 [Gelatoporia subvermispora B]|uniref:Uncharacterized protein n=1 Tax=Ceriporiopsis subvermispora (strain B) TaxID=914234 RepID=M2QJ56_CERS8|nr:hypothetical protein CERSUDRAFT_114969 [Gelatoporia subvermispora B]